MNKKFTTTIFALSIFQSLYMLFGFFNGVALTTLNTAWINIYSFQTFSGVMYWSILSMLSIVIFTLILYLMIQKAYPAQKNIGLILGMIGSLAPIIFSFFLIVPATFMILAAIFMKLLLSEA
ncbi:hypothetical protein H9L19_00460 [Weissella diestrammenae]|uniref:DUF4064 domain-containing protein n=1 Tax=Weissella diestrammenae TaxID=1162633 RepID=A0A7G9T5N8_9LACO|nr:hypothetical protein [Weissella diestrammenae]MCM0582239.1 hypothetical protein [Weissella diestrammenae]QNN75413.1 hypothetical protein H9L19_00460 [Weissella diestrammenae]